MAAGGPARAGSALVEAKPVSVVVGQRGRGDVFLGSQVRHARFGEGTVTGVEGNKLEIEFETAGTKRVLDTFVDVVA